MKNRVGEKHITNEGCEIEIIEYISAANITIRFKSGIILNNRTYQNIKKGQIKNPNIKNICEVGYFGVGRYGTKQHRKLYVVWTNMIRRCYDEEVREKCPTYKDVTVCEEWHNFQNFAGWFEENWKEYMNSEWHLDKDVLYPDCKIYSPETCCFLPREINNAFNRHTSKRGEFLIGTNRSGLKIQARISKYGKSLFIGYFNTSEEAFQAYKVAKEEYIKELAEKWKSLIKSKVYQALINYKMKKDD